MLNLTPLRTKDDRSALTCTLSAGFSGGKRLQNECIYNRVDVCGLQDSHHCSVIVVLIVTAVDQRRGHWLPKEPSVKFPTCRSQLSIAVQMSVVILGVFTVLFERAVAMY